jgi:hypothetical protein
MASVIYNAAMLNEAKGNIDYDSDSFKVMLVTSSYTPDVDAHDYRNDVTNEVTGTGYTAGGKATTVTLTQNNTNNRVEIAFASVTWTGATFTARGAVIYKSRGGAASADELVAYLDFGSNQSASGADFTVNFTNPLYKAAA